MAPPLHKMIRLKLTAMALVGMLLLGNAGCGGGGNNAGSGAPAPQSAPQQRQGMSTKQKVMLVAGAAALYYLYKKHQNAQGTGAQGQYYRSKNGRIYYRDKNGKAIWVTEPEQPIPVPTDEYERVFGRQASGDGGVVRQAPAGW